MFTKELLLSLFWKFVYGFVLAATAYIQGWVTVNTDVHGWTLVGFLAGAGVVILAFAKKFLFNEVLPRLFGVKAG